MKYRRLLFKTSDPFDTFNTEELFVKAVKENCKYQYDYCPEYKKILDSMNFKPDFIDSYNDIEKIPFIHTLFFKNHHIYSMPSYKMIKATSSGTKGKFSNIGFDLSGLLCGLRMVLKIGKRRKLFSLKPANYIVFGYKPHRKNKTAVTKTAFGATLFTPAIGRTYALKYKNGKYGPDLEGVVNAIGKYSKSKFPLRFMGFPSYTYFVLKIMDERGMILFKGDLYHSRDQDYILNQLEAEINKTRRTKTLNPEQVIAAIDKLGQLIDKGEFDDEISQLNIDGIEKYIDIILMSLRRENIEYKVKIELGEHYFEIQRTDPPFNQKKILIRPMPLGTLLHIAAGNIDGLPVFSVAEGLITGNVNI